MFDDSLGGVMVVVVVLVVVVAYSVFYVSAVCRHSHFCRNSSITLRL